MLYADDIRAHCMKKKGTTEEEPFGPGTVTYKVMGKIFLFLPLDVEVPMVAVKVEPNRLIEIREQYQSVSSGKYLNPKHWARLDLHGDIPPKVIYELIDSSYDLIVSKLTKAQKAELASV